MVEFEKLRPHASLGIIQLDMRDLKALLEPSPQQCIDTLRTMFPEALKRSLEKLGTGDSADVFSAKCVICFADISSIVEKVTVEPGDIVQHVKLLRGLEVLRQLPDNT